VRGGNVAIIIPMVRRLVSGGQTGADRAALDWALAHSIEHGGWCPHGRRAEDGLIPTFYQLTETPSHEYRQRTAWNVRDSDATVIFSIAVELLGGSKLTAEVAEHLGKPWLHARPDSNSAAALRKFVEDHQVEVLNVAGPRASEEPGVYAFVTATLNAAFGMDAGRKRV
jgi:hypothetical protein